LVKSIDEFAAHLQRNDISKGNIVRPLIDGHDFFGEIEKVINSLGRKESISSKSIPSEFFYLVGWSLILYPGITKSKTGYQTQNGDKLYSNEKTSTQSYPAMLLKTDSAKIQPEFNQILVEKAARGVDVKLLGWVNPLLVYENLVTATQQSLWDIIANNLKSIYYLRTQVDKSHGFAPLRNNICALTVGHPMGSVHLKVVIAGNAKDPIAFIGGMDFVPNRISSRDHTTRFYYTGTVSVTNGRTEVYGDKTKWSTENLNKFFEVEGDSTVSYRIIKIKDPETLIIDRPYAGASANHKEYLIAELDNWHDAAISVRGPAVQILYDLFTNLWNEQLRRPVETFFLIEGSKEVQIPSYEGGSLQMRPRTFHKKQIGNHMVLVSRTLPVFRFQLPRRTQSLSFSPNGTFEIAELLMNVIGNATKYIYIEDQYFYSQEIMDWINHRIRSCTNLKVILVQGEPDPADKSDKNGYIEKAVNEHLLGIKPNKLSSSQKKQIGYFTRVDKVIIHSKLLMVDDICLVIGSANCARRSLYTDIECNIASMDTTGQLVKKTRADLWGEQLGVSSKERSKLEDIQFSLGLWKKEWGNSTIEGTSKVKEFPIPLVPVPFNIFYPLEDPDSRSPPF
jgi:phosphatidylserine/phosphatidylglycerophosphate/cardiolipin synthase-like enzyme